ncbi:tRNA threonylcarbamoyladenosine biosynthesis protein TsaE [Flavobacterium bizetiae]|uniref:tRNA threonylcarbamoyladenosine biosynthesis protein TsaE n=1 Tax=Flavobacterium bizetiae TaxID=2704140 RepID=A0A6J4GVH2_9FLAO|nr:tRNA (adenosine(37)-N6)-threonylcarbamoyltransferase complex ATPase subunit type 1 TsaE [Flavobacterium bizetiae]CAA9203334.1 tRNA threonylcarbamoyladenosine biosynthesis protein TsaE [Flavobacterium bizetiae]CAD5342939.1 tRNA threonylcarbamoyladenosine biosynthesis protein TsaE [Flavobacterium bizetiae]CAD5350530.1 tRNA threonylcarbamoyladenosine biosynthesis protein TsaE [Flavobacterium bizetiae]
MNIVFSLDQIKEVAEQILAQNPKKIILFNGEMGVGKTTLIKQLCKSLGVQDATSSPTFSLVNEYYTSNNQIVYHFDFYRLNKETEALDMGVDDYLYSGNWCFIEWSEKIASLLPEETSIINIELLADGKRSLELI